MDNLYIIVLQFSRIDPKTKKKFINEEIYIKKRYTNNMYDQASIVIDVNHLKMVKDRYAESHKDDSETKVVLDYIKQLASRNHDVNRIWIKLKEFFESKNSTSVQDETNSN